LGAEPEPTLRFGPGWSPLHVANDLAIISGMKHLLTIVSISLLAATVASAQTGSALVIQPWYPDMLVEAGGSVTVFDDGQSEQGFDVDLIMVESAGRARLPEDADLRLSFGYDLTYIDIDGNDPRLPGQLTDQSVGFGLRVGEYEGWTIDVTGGVGFAGDSAYDDSDAWYGMASVVGTTQIDDRSTLQIAIDWDGNRAAFPDVPLPAIIFTRVENEQFTWSAGVPFSMVVWKPTEQLIITGRYVLPFNGSVKVEYFIIKELSLFGSFDTHTGRFHIDDSRDNDHLMFRQRRLEGGLTWKACANFEATVAGGWAFDQEFSRGWHAIDDTDEFELDDEPYFRIGITGRF
jgi:hypothetical protein